jgi:2-C-methyl-D-erythritol 4-phosphate cytidylyltransferase
MYLSAIVLAAGRGLRFSRLNSSTARGGVLKPLAEINSKPVIIYSLDILSRHPAVRDIIVVVNAGNSRSIISKVRRYRIAKIRRIVEGGKRRQDSVHNALKAMDNRTDLVLIHDGVRPFIDKETVSAVIKEARDSGAAVVGVPVKATIKKVTSRAQVKETLNRDCLWEIQTPQVFRKDLILKAYKRFGRGWVTDDASLVEKSGAKVKIVMGSYSNIKITTPDDLILAKAIAKKD